MLLFLLLLPLGGIEILIILAAVWQRGPDSWHPALAVGYGVCLIIATYAITKRYRAGSAERNLSLAAQAHWHWPADMDAEQFRLRLITALQLQGWRINHSTADGLGHVEVLVRKDRWKVALICLAPAHRTVDAADWERLAAFRKADGASHAALVSPRPRGDDPIGGPSGMILLSYDDLAAFDSTIGMNI